MLNEFVEWLRRVYDIDVSEEAVEFEAMVSYKGDLFRNKTELKKHLEMKPMVLQDGMATIDDESVEHYCSKLRESIINRILKKL